MSYNPTTYNTMTGHTAIRGPDSPSHRSSASGHTATVARQRGRTHTHITNETGEGGEGRGWRQVAAVRLRVKTVKADTEF